MLSCEAFSLPSLFHAKPLARVRWLAAGRCPQATFGWLAACKPHPTLRRSRTVYLFVFLTPRETLGLPTFTKLSHVEVVFQIPTYPFASSAGILRSSTWPNLLNYLWLGSLVSAMSLSIRSKMYLGSKGSLEGFLIRDYSRACLFNYYLRKQADDLMSLVIKRELPLFYCVSST